MLMLGDVDHGITLDVATYFDSFGIETHSKRDSIGSIGSTSLLTNIFRVKAYNSVICGYFCIGFIDHILAGETLIDNTSLFLSHDS